MGVVNISLPNLGTEEALIATTIANIESAVPDSLSTFLNPRFIFKGSEDCSTFYLDDVTDYDEVSVVDPADVTRNVTYIYRTECGDIIPCPSEPLSANGRLEFENTYGDGEYCVSIEVTYTITPVDPMDPVIVHTETFEECLTQSCCKNNLLDLRKEIMCCMSGLTCTIDSYKNIGRNTVKLMSKYLKMSNLLWVIDHTKQSCDDYKDIACIYKMI